jgi:hypothetical protein
MKTSILIVTFRRDIEFCTFALKSIAKFAAGFLETVVVVPESDKELFGALHATYNFKLRPVPEPAGKGMLNQMLVKSTADSFCPQADFILHFDSDYIFTAPVTPETYFRDGKPVLVCNPYENVTEAGHRQWQRVAQNAVGFAVPFDTMCRLPIIHLAEVYPKLRAHVENHTGLPLEEFIMGGRAEYPQSYAEFPTIGAIALHFFRDEYTVVDLSKEPEPKNPIMRGWSHGGMDHEMLFQDGETTTARKKWAQYL